MPFKKAKIGRVIATAQAAEFWVINKLMAEYVGCYIFGFRAARGLKPVYIGKATKSFRQEVFTDHKRNKYNESLANQAKGTPVLFFVVQDKKSGPINRKAIDEAETFLIASGLVANKHLLNDKKTAVESWGIKGVLRGGKGKPTQAAKSLKRCLSL